ncbi:hypothetical protein GCM10011320_38580 [Neoroseomonas lacus]|uniref:Glycosyltransferase RgtA/B/C/D-like domain-containing protein n=1 Tax=Neoroseomonas lacus TaxID=287609 RepID=A0A917KUG2_9PROT|nr:hypothetical protein GCM10011320_38580 [Neoroseomonas lacus]
MAAAAALRLPALGGWSLWADEVATAGLASLSWAELTGTLPWLETTPPVYYLLIKGWTALAGDSDAALRVPSALAGIASVAALGLLCRDAFGRRAAFWAALVLAVTGWHLFHSREARVYAILTLVFLLALLAGRGFAARAVRPGGSWVWSALGLAIISVLAAWLHFAGMIAAATAYLYVLLLMLGRRSLDPRAMGRFLVAGMAAALLVLPVLWLAWVLTSTDEYDGMAWLGGLGYRFAAVSLSRVVLLAPPVLDPWPVLGPACAAVAALLVAVLAWRSLRAGSRTAERMAWAGALLGGMALFLLAQAVGPIVLPRTLQLLVPLVAGLMGLGIAGMRPGVLRVGLFLAFVVSQAPGLHDIFRTPPDGSDWRDLAARLAAAPRDGSVVIALDAFDALAFDRYRAPGGPVADLVLLPAEGPELQRFATARLTSATPVAPEALLATLCGGAMAGSGLLVVERLSPLLDEARRILDTALRPAGAQPGAASGSRSLRLRPWTPPACPARPSAARP